MPHRNPEATACTALRPNGKFCDGKSLPDAPFPICVTCAAKVLRYLQDCMPSDPGDLMLMAVRRIEHERVLAPRKSATADREVVYYLRVGEHIKVGYTADLRSRMNQYPPTSELLAVEPGGYEVEQQRHRQFASLLSVAKEWFDPGADLLAHIDAVRARHDLRQFLPPKRSPVPLTDKYGRRLTA